MKVLTGLLLLFGLWVSGFVAVISFWVWLGTLLIWKIFAVVGASALVFPAFWTMIISAIVVLILFVIAVIVD